VTGTILWIFGDVAFAYIYKGLIFHSYIIALVSLVPFTFKDGSDGLLIWSIFENRFKEA
jgi:hypothetical protein